MSTYNNVSMACVKRESTVWGWGRVSVAWVGVTRTVMETSANFTLPGESGHPAKGTRQCSGVVSGTTVRALVLGRFSQKKIKNRIER